MVSFNRFNKNLKWFLELHLLSVIRLSISAFSFSDRWIHKKNTTWPDQVEWDTKTIMMIKRTNTMMMIRSNQSKSKKGIEKKLKNLIHTIESSIQQLLPILHFITILYYFVWFFLYMIVQRIGSACCGWW